MNSAQSTNVEIEEYMRIEKRSEDRVRKIVFVGPRSSGKTTIIKQMECSHKFGAEMNEMINCSSKIIKTCYWNAVNLCIMINDNKHKEKLNKLSINNDNDLIEIGNIIWNVWKQNIAKQTYILRHIYNPYCYEMIDNLDYFFDNIHKVMSLNYESTLEDWTRFHTKSNNVNTIQIEYENDGYLFSVSDIPSTFIDIQFRKKGYMFDKASCYIFVAALSDFCVYRSDGKNALKYAINMFGNIVNSKWTKKQEMILVLNKFDIFQKQINAGIPISECFDNDEKDEDEYDKYQNEWDETEWDPPIKIGNIKFEMAVPHFLRNIYNDEYIPIDIIELIQKFVHHINIEEELLNQYIDYAIQFIQNKFISRNINQYKRIFCHVTTGTDQEMMKKIIWDFKNIIIRSNTSSS